MKFLTTGEKIFTWCNYTFLALLAAATLYPFLYVISASLSSSEAVLSGDVVLFPKEWTLQAFRQVLTESGIWRAYGNTVFYTIDATCLQMVFTIMGAYPLSKKRFMGRTPISFFIAFTMLFNAGMIPFYLTIKELGILNTRWALLIPFAVTTFLVILLRTHFQSVPEEMEEAAKVDGASDFQILTRIYLPVSKPALATISLFYAVGTWNSYFWAMVLIQDESKIPLQVLLRRLVVSMNPTEGMMATTDSTVLFSQETVIYATIVIAIIPVIVVYPFIQKYFTAGAMVGSVKG
ncbi:carbohydrate ABC transporter permease [Paenibacillus oryzisoli]|uniref:Sugar ABC transporter permease n=1 Tax=Paenibacillus oryzisoli TaxID=1850517 RepID=A0A198A0Y6_9BACL|nr:carbohydrate ABC transporter permease [Paenibacillus oryzisoli]OAS15119.1 sugar ABC transporter permease [Paenibacillus oryzisoli]